MQIRFTSCSARFFTILIRMCLKEFLIRIQHRMIFIIDHWIITYFEFIGPKSSFHLNQIANPSLATILEYLHVEACVIIQLILF